MFNFFQKILPQHGLSRGLAKLAHSQNPFFKNWAIKIFSHYFKVNLAESLINDPLQFSSFNDFFIRKLKSDARPLPHEREAIISPADGVISEFGKIDSGQLLQAKGRYYSLIELLGGDTVLAQKLSKGAFLTIYLAPKDYHRVHMPADGILKKMIYVPGKLFSVNATSVKGVPRLFSRNERVICLFETSAGPCVLIFVGALLIGSVVTSWHGQVMPVASDGPIIKNYSESTIRLSRGEEAGYFQWGSTVIALFNAEQMRWDSSLSSGNPIRMGEKIGEYTVFPSCVAS